MVNLKSILSCKLFEAADRAGISTAKQILILSVWDIKKLTNLTIEDIIAMKNQAAECYMPQIITCEKLSSIGRVSSGCANLDSLLKGGFRKGTITEIYGESGSGKTQIALQAAAHSWPDGSVFICTEDLFPVKRFEQIKEGVSSYNPAYDYGNNIFVKHITEAQDLLSCVRVQLPKLVEKNKLSLVVVDSVAAPFRSEYSNYVLRAEDLRELALSLIKVSQAHNLAILCINQVSASLNGPNDVLPSLGLAWSNMINTRLKLKKAEKTFFPNFPSKDNVKGPQLEHSVQIRELSVIFAPDLCDGAVEFIITPTGVQSI